MEELGEDRDERAADGREARGTGGCRIARHDWTQQQGGHPACHAGACPDIPLARATHNHLARRAAHSSVRVHQRRPTPPTRVQQHLCQVVAARISTRAPALSPAPSPAPSPSPGPARRRHHAV